MDGKEAAHFLERAKDLLELAAKIKSDQHRKLLIDSAENFLKLAMQVLGPEKDR
jgi:hypothetical protein